MPPRANSLKPAASAKAPSQPKAASPASSAVPPKAKQPAPPAKAREEPKYAPPEASYLAERIWFPFYDNFVKLYPKSWTPNGITLFGIFSTVLASVILLSSMPSMMRPLGTEHTQYDAPSQDALDAATKFPEQSGLNPAVDESFAKITGNHIAGIMSRENRGDTAGLYGKNIAIVPQSIARVASEFYAIAKDGKVTQPANPTDQHGNPILGRANQYDYQRPQLFYKAIQTPFGRVEIAVRLLWHAISENVCGFVKQSCPDTHQMIFGTIEKYALAAHSFIGDIINQIAAALPDEISATPGRWMLILGGFLNLVYCVADNTDGRHARRTKQSSYVGEYLDHGLDCVTSLLTTYLLTSALGLEASQASVAVLAVAFATVLSHLVNQEKGFLIWGNRAFSVDEAMIAFGVGMIVVGIFPSFVPSLVPVDTLVSLGVPASWLPPALAHVRVGELIWFGFLASQLSVVATLLKVDRTVIFRPSSLALIANIAAICYLTNTVGQPTLLRDQAFAAAVHSGDIEPNTFAHLVRHIGLQDITALRLLDSILNLVFVYEAQWVILAACTSSIVIHAPISAKCLKVNKGTNNTPTVLVLPLAIVTFFFVSSGIGAAIAVAGHVVQILLNVNKLQRRGEERAAQKK